MYADRQNQSEKLFIAGFKSSYCDVVQSQSWYAWAIIYLCEMAIRLSALYDKAKKNLDKIRQCINGKYGFGMDPKTKNKALRKLDRENLIQLHLLENSGKAPQVRLLTK